MLTHKSRERASNRRSGSAEFYQTYSKGWNPPIWPGGPVEFVAPPVVEKYQRVWTHVRIPQQRDRKSGTKQPYTPPFKGKYPWKQFQSYVSRVVVPPSPIRPKFVLRNYTGGPDYGQVTQGSYSPWLTYFSHVTYNAWGPPGKFILGLPSLTADQPDGGFVPPPANLSALVDDSLRAVLPRIRAEVSLPNTLFELKDFRRLPQTIANLRAFGSDLSTSIAGVLKGPLKGLSARIRSSFSKDAGPTLRELTRSTADAHLQNEFAVKPLMSDVSGIHSALVNTQKKINSLLSLQNKVLTKHFTVQVPILSPFMSPEQTLSNYGLTGDTFVGTEFPPGYTGYYRGPVAPAYEARRSILTMHGTFHAQVEYSYSFTPFQVKYASILGHLDALGVNLNPAIIWNAIPWSFLVDWLIGVGRLLDSLKEENLKPVTSIRRYLWSWKVERMVNLTVSTLPDRVGGRLSLLNETAYRRDVTMPTGSSIITSGLSNNELILGVSLLITKKWRPKRGRH